MRIYMLMGQRPCSYPGEYGPELIVAWDEFCVEQNPDGWEEAKKEELQHSAGEFVDTREVVVVCAALGDIFDEIVLDGEMEES